MLRTMTSPGTLTRRGVSKDSCDLIVKNSITPRIFLSNSCMGSNDSGVRGLRNSMRKAAPTNAQSHRFSFSETHSVQFEGPNSHK